MTHRFDLPPAQRAAGLQVSNLLGQQRLVGGEIRHDALEPPRVRALDGDLAMLEAGLTAGHEVVTPLRELRRRHAMATTEALV